MNQGLLSSRIILLLNMKSNKLVSHLSNYWFFHLLWAIFAVVAITFEFNILTKPKENEKVDLFICANVINEKELKNYLKQNQPEYLKTINYRIIEPESLFFGQVFYTYGEVETDIFIMPESKAKNIKAMNYFLPLDNTSCNTIFEKELTYYVDESDSVTYGIKVNSSYFDTIDEDLFLLFSKKSLHLGELNNQELDGDISIAKLFI